MGFRKLVLLAVAALVIIIAIKAGKKDDATVTSTDAPAVEGTTTDGSTPAEGEAAPAEGAEITPATDGAAAPDAVTPATKDTGEASGEEVPAESADEVAPAEGEAAH